MSTGTDGADGPVLQQVIADNSRSVGRPQAFTWTAAQAAATNFQPAVQEWRAINGEKLAALGAKAAPPDLERRFRIFARKRPILPMDALVATSESVESNSTSQNDSEESAAGSKCPPLAESTAESTAAGTATGRMCNTGPIATNGVQDYEFLSVFSPFVFRHVPATRLGVRTGRLTSIPSRFDAAFGDNSESDDRRVYGDVVAPLVQHALRGGRSTVIAFGQTGSGKTHTVVELQQAALQHLFGELKRRQGVEDASEAPPFDIDLCVFENYRHELYDLMDANHTKLECREGASGAMHIAGVARRHAPTLVSSPMFQVMLSF